MPPTAAPSSWMSLRRELRAAGGFVFGLLGFFLGFVYRGDLLVAPVLEFQRPSSTGEG